MNKLNKWTFLFALVIFAGCSNGTQNKKAEEPTSEKTYTLQGTVLLSNGDRSATTSFAKLDSLTYKVTAYNVESETYTQANPAVAELVEEEGNIHYSFKIKEAGTWVITASANYAVNDSTSVEVMSATKNWTVAENAATGASIGVGDIVLNVKGYYVDTKGSIDLTIYDQTNKVVKVTMNAKALISTSQNSARVLTKTINFSGTYEAGKSERTAVIQLEDIIPNCYEISFDFFNDKGKIIYSCKEAVSVFGGYKTDKWIKSSGTTGSHLVYDSNSETTKFIITSELFNALNQAGDLDYPIILWNALTDENVPDECDHEWDSWNEKYQTFILTQKTKSEQYPVGIKAFGKVVDGTTISNIMGSFTKAFCFDNHTDPVVIYSLDDSYEEINIYTQTYSSFKEKGSIPLDTIINARLDEGYELDTIYPAIAYSNPYLFFFFNTVQGTYHLGGIDVSADDPTDPANFVFCDTNTILDDITCMDVNVVDSDKTMICYASRNVHDNDNEIYIRGLKFEGGTIAFDESINSTVEVDAGTTALGITLPGGSVDLELTDLQILNDILYIALSMHGKESDMDTESYVKIDDEYIKKPIVISNGGIAKIDLSAPGEGGVYSFANWENGKTLLGWHTGTIYSDSTGSDSRTVTLPPYPFNDDDEEWDDTKFFYGARKFIARKPDELVIADDGGYLDIEYDKQDKDNLVLGSVDSANKNRVVTVNLASESLSTVDVDVTFDKTFSLFNNSDSYMGTGFANN